VFLVSAPANPPHPPVSPSPLVHELTLRKIKHPIKQRLVAKPPLSAQVNLFISGYTHQTYTYLFEGSASHQGNPCPNALIALEISTPHNHQFAYTRTHADGTYSLAVSLTGAPEETVDWDLSAQSDEAEEADIQGRTIILDDGETAVTVRRPVELIAHQTQPFEINFHTPRLVKL
jgi:hypothetical protein